MKDQQEQDGGQKEFLPLRKQFIEKGGIDGATTMVEKMIMFLMIILMTTISLEQLEDHQQDPQTIQEMVMMIQLEEDLQIATGGTFSIEIDHHTSLQEDHQEEGPQEEGLQEEDPLEDLQEADHQQDHQADHQEEEAL